MVSYISWWGFEANIILFGTCRRVAVGDVRNLVLLSNNTAKAANDLELVMYHHEEIERISTLLERSVSPFSLSPKVAPLLRFGA